ncbi:MAG: hypothetical protein ABEJ27_02945 [Halodesulfurarchaeum sp.]
MSENVGDRFDRLPETAPERTVDGRPTRTEVLAWWEDRFEIPNSTFDGYTFWEKGSGKIWALHHDLEEPVRIEALGMPVLRTRQEHWKPTTDAAQRFGSAATKNVISLQHDRAVSFLAGEDQAIEWEGDWGYLIAAHDIAGRREPIGVGLYTYGELTSMVPKGRRRQF